MTLTAVMTGLISPSEGAGTAIEFSVGIAAAIYKGCDSRVSPGLCRQAADAVIRELGLRQERVQLLTRYVTEWVQ